MTGQLVQQGPEPHLGEKEDVEIEPAWSRVGLARLIAPPKRMPLSRDMAAVRRCERRHARAAAIGWSPASG